MAAVGLALVGWCVIGRRQRSPMAPALRLAAGCWLALAAWVLVAGRVAGDTGAALPMAAVALMLAAALLAVTGLAPEQRAHAPPRHRGGGAGGGADGLDRRRTAPRALGAAVPIPVAGFGDAHLRQLGRGLPRGSDAARGPSPGSGTVDVGRRGDLTALGVGWATTLSRGSALSLFLGVAVALAVARLTGGSVAVWRQACRPLLAVIPGVAIGFATLVPSLPEADDPHPQLATIGLAAGMVVSAIAVRLSRGARKPEGRATVRSARWAVRGAAALLIVGTAVVALAISSGHETGRSIAGAATSIVETRFSRSSSDRSDLQRVTWRQFAEHPLLGVGPGNSNLHYTSSSGQPVQAEYTHNEYLQLASEVGIPGVVLAAGSLAALAWSFVGRRRRAGLVRSGSHVAGLALVAPSPCTVGSTSCGTYQRYPCSSSSQRVVCRTATVSPILRFFDQPRPSEAAPSEEP